MESTVYVVARLYILGDVSTSKRKAVETLNLVKVLITWTATIDNWAPRTVSTYYYMKSEWG